jgi:hypothetical protein
MFSKRLGAAAVTAALAVGLNTGTALAASGGSNSGSAPDLGNCFGNFVNQGSNGYNVSNFGPPAEPGGPSDLGQFIGRETHGCRD